MDNLSVVSNNYTNLTCKPSINFGQYTLYSLIPASIIIVLLACTLRRVKRIGYCNGYPGLIYPVDFLRYDQNRFAHAAAFGATAGACLQIFEKKFFLFGITAQSSAWLQMVNNLVSVIVIGFSYYPILACLSTHHELLGSVLGLFYSLSWLTIKMIIIIECPNGMDSDDNLIALVGVPGYSVLSNLPEICCLAYIVFKFTINLLRIIRNQRSDAKGNLVMASTHQFAHVRSILKYTKRYYRTRITDNSPELPLSSKISRKFFYKSRPEFKYPTRILATFLVAQIAVYKIAFVYVFTGYENFRLLRTLFYTTEYIKIIDIDKHNGNATLSSTHMIFTLIVQGITVLQASWTVSTITSCSLILVYSLHMISCIRKHLLRLYCGSKSFLPYKKFSPTMTMADNLRYSGYQIGYILWGFIILQIFLFMVCILIAYFIVLPFVTKIPPVLLDFLISIWPSIAISAAAYLAQLLLARFYLLKNGGKDGLVIDNRRLLSNVTYFLFFYNIILGLFSALFRLLESLFLGILFISRLDKSLLIRGYESWDSGHSAYLGFLQMEFQYNHPAASVFCQLLVDNLQGNVNGLNCINSTIDENYYQQNNPSIRRTISKVARNRWLLAVTLLNNQTLIAHRRTKFVDSFTISKRVDECNSDDELLLFQD